MINSYMKCQKKKLFKNKSIRPCNASRCITHQKQSSEVVEITKKLFYAHCLRVKNKVFSKILIELDHVAVHGGQFVILLSGDLCKAVGFY